MQRRNYAALIAAAAFGATIVGGLAGVSYGDETIASHHPNDRANHHPVHETVRENQAVVTQLGADATAISYWASAPDGWHVVTTVDTVIGKDTGAEQHAITRFSATLAPGQQQLISVPAAIGAQPLALRIRRIGDRIEMMRVADPSI